MRAVGYVRVSTDKQAERGVSLAEQEARLRAYAHLYELDLVSVISEDASAKSLDRPGLQRALGALEPGMGLLVAKLDRLTRSVRDLCDLCDTVFKDCALLSVGEQIDTRTAAGRLVLNVLSSVSQWEREAIGERTKAAMGHLRREGRYTGGHVPYGYKLAQPDVAQLGTLDPATHIPSKQNLVECPKEQAIITQVRTLGAQGLSIRRISALLGPVGRGDKPLTTALLHSLLARAPANA